MIHLTNRLSAVRCLAAVAAVMLLASCGTARHATTTTTKPTTPTFSVPTYMKKVVANQQTVPTMRAKLSFAIDADGKQFNVGGSLKMKRNDVIQLSLVALGIIEAGRMEFTQDSVLIVDRINQQYTRAAYSQVKFLRDAGIDFYCLQSLFWNELFIPGDHGTPSASRFKATPSGQSVVLEPENTQKLAYRFITDVATGLIKQTNISSRELSVKEEFNWRYNSFTKFEGKSFPDNFTLSLDGGSKKLRVDMELSRFSDDSSWETRTKVSSKYKKVDAEAALKKIMSL